MTDGELDLSLALTMTGRYDESLEVIRDAKRILRLKYPATSPSGHEGHPERSQGSALLRTTDSSMSGLGQQFRMSLERGTQSP